MMMLARALALGVVLACASVAPAQATAPSAAPLGSPAFQLSESRTIGWRGDGTGRYPGATPPTTWERKKIDAGYQTKGIVWMTPMPATGVSSPIIVRQRIFLTSEVCDLVCIDKQTGKILWIRSNPEFEGLSEEERRANPAFAENLAPLLSDLAKANADVVETLNAQLATAPTDAPRQPSKAILRKREIEKKINDQQVALDKRMFDRYWGQGVFGFAGPTPTSDGKHVCAFFTTGVAACYDLDGNRLWITRGAGGGSEHGNFASPLLAGGRLCVWANEMRAYEVATGKLAWSNPAKAFNTYGSLFRLQSGGELVAAFQWGFFVRVRDGQVIWDKGIFGDSIITPIVEGDTIFARVGYPRNNHEKLGFKAYRIPASTESGKLTPAYEFKINWADDELPVDQKKNPFDRDFAASPLFVDGLIYQITQAGGLVVNDAATGELVYRKVLGLKPRIRYWDWGGCCTSPTMAGKLIYLMDNQGSTVIIEAGKTYKEVARNVVEESRDGKEQVQNLATPVFEGKRMYNRTPLHLYCIGE